MPIVLAILAVALFLLTTPPLWVAATFGGLVAMFALAAVVGAVRKGC